MIKWKKYFSLINSEKDASRTKAIEIFPYFSLNLSKKKDSNKADAILIASFYYETFRSMADTYLRATNDEKSAAEITEFAKKFGKMAGVVK